MQARVDWVLIISGTQVIEKKRPVRPVFPEYLSVSYDYDVNDLSNASSVLDSIMYADDTSLFYSNNDIETLFSAVNMELEKISE